MNPTGAVRDGASVRRREVRLTKGDLELIGHLNRVGHSLGEDLAVAVGRPAGGVGKRLAALRAAGWVERQQPVLGPAAWRATTGGLACARLGSAGPDPVSASLWLHQTTLACLAAHLVARGLLIRTERELRAETRGTSRRREAGVPLADASLHLPDLLVHLPDGVVAVELELSAKAPRRLRAILSAYAAAARRVLYLVPPPLEPLFTRCAEDPVVQPPLRLRVRPAPIAARPPERPERPDPQAARRIADEFASLAGRP